jgi:hypothetical protein
MNNIEAPAVPLCGVCCKTACNNDPPLAPIGIQY